jgi:tripartite-type tricarboxylate transporter receptor subunit TctC
MRTTRWIAAIVWPLLLMLPHAQAAYPDKPIRWVIGSAPGSGPDIISRLVADRLYAAMGQRVVIDSRPGVAGLLSADIVQRSAADGYTWMMLTSQLLIATRVYSNHKIDLERDFASVSLIGSVPFTLIVNPQVPAKSVTELIDAARKSQPPLRYGSAGSGATEHLCGVLFNRMANTTMLHVPYKGIGQAIADTVAREVHMTFPVLPAALPMVQAGRVRALGVTTRKRAALLPDVPTIAESLPGYELYGWYSLVVPSGTPQDIVAKVSAEVVKIVKDPAFGEQLKGQGIDIVGSSRAELDAFRADQTRRTIDLIKSSGVDVKQ